VGLALLFASMAASAEEPKFEYGKKEEVKEEEWKLSAQLGILLTAGNSRSITINGGANFSYKAQQNKLSAEIAGALARTSVLVAADANGDGFIGPGEFSREDTSAAKALAGKVRYDRFLDDADSLFVTAKAGFDEPAGKKLAAGGQLGYSRVIYNKDGHTLVGEAGYDFSYESYYANVDAITIHSLRLFLGYTAKVSDVTGFAASVEEFSNLNKETVPQGEASPFEDTRVTTKAELTTKIVEKISLKVGVKVLYDNVPAPLPPFSIPFAAGFFPLADKVDFVGELALIVNFL
jgi:putative salt-induced outer membrane protein YdiY